MKRSIALSGWLISGALMIAPPAAAQQESADAQAAQPQDNVQSRVEAMLAGVERVPTAEDWAALGEGALPALIAVMNDSRATIVTRGRAAIGLGYFEHADSAAALKTALLDASTPTLVLRKSIVSLARITRERAVEPVAPFLDHRSKRVREVAIKAMGGIATVDARSLLEARLPREKSKLLRDLIDEQLSKSINGVRAASSAAPVAHETAAESVE